MKTFFISMGILCMTVSIFGQQVAKSLTTGGGLFVGFYEYKPSSYAANPAKKYPLMIFLHGVGERGNGTTELSRVLANGAPANIKNGSKMAFTVNGITDTFMVLSPQLSTYYTGWVNAYIDAMYDYAMANLRVDPDRVYLTGLSAGGGGTWDYVTSVSTNASKFAAIVVSCGVGPANAAGVCYMNQAHLPVWAFHAKDDPTVGVGATTAVINAMYNTCTPKPDPLPLAKYFTTGGHGIWGMVYDESHTYQNPNVFEWMLMHKRGVTPVNQAPVARAGNDTVISLPSNKTYLNGKKSTDADGRIAEYEWSKISGPDNFTIVTASKDTTTVKNMVAGSYKFALRTIDYYGKAGYDTMNVRVDTAVGNNIAPVSHAGNNFSTTNTYAYLSGGASYDPDGYIIAYDWKQSSGPAATLVNAQTSFPTVQNIKGGVYKFQLTVYDNKGKASNNFVTLTNPTATLPVEYAYLKARKLNNKNVVQWGTATEQNSDFFEIERSEDGVTFFTIGTLAAAGNSSVLKEYSFTDNQITKSKQMYRLRQVDKDGELKLSKIITVAADDTKSVAVFYPNPVKEKINVLLNNTEKGNGVINIYSIDGKLLQQQSFYKAQYEFAAMVDAQKLKTGVYLVEINVGKQFKTVERLVKN